MLEIFRFCSLIEKHLGIGNSLKDLLQKRNDRKRKLTEDTVQKQYSSLLNLEVLSAAP